MEGTPSLARVALEGVGESPPLTTVIARDTVGPARTTRATACSTAAAGEENWFVVVDSKCRQHLWGAWSGGDYQGVEPTLDEQADPIAYSFNEWCSRVPEKPFLTVAGLA